ncbi:hypothetical protein GN956_G2257 [Arapaima gigas]
MRGTSRSARGLRRCPAGLTHNSENPSSVFTHKHTETSTARRPGFRHKPLPSGWNYTSKTRGKRAAREKETKYNKLCCRVSLE